MGAQIPVRMCAKKRRVSGTSKATSISVRRRGRRCCCPRHPAPGPASNPPGSVGAGAPEPPLTPCPAPPGSPPATPAPAPAPVLQLTASVAPRQDLRINHGRVYLLVGCNMVCSLYAHGHLNLLRGRGRGAGTGVAQHPQIARGRSHGRHQALALPHQPDRGAPRAERAPQGQGSDRGAGDRGERQEPDLPGQRGIDLAVTPPPSRAGARHVVVNSSL